MLEISNVTVSYDDQRAVDDVSLAIEPGEIVGIVGPNGAGKSTLFKTVVGILKQDKGTIELDGCTITDVAKREMGYLAEQPFLFDFFTPAEMLLFERSIRFPDISDDVIEELLITLGLQEYKDSPIKSLSQGLKKRVAIALAFVSNPAVLVLDEPLNAIDIQTVIVLKRLIQEASELNSHILISSHVLNFFDGLIEKVVFLERGSIRYISSNDASGAEEVYKKLFMTQ